MNYVALIEMKCPWCGAIAIGSSTNAPWCAKCRNGSALSMTKAE